MKTSKRPSRAGLSPDGVQRWAGAGFTETGGAAALEFALMAPLLLVLLVGVAAFGIGIWYDMEVHNALAAGIEDAAAHGFDATAISSAVNNATLLPVTASPSPTQFCGCPTTSGVTSILCTSSCPSGLSPGTFVQVTATAAYNPIIQYPFVPAQFNLVAQGEVRIK